MARPNSSGRIRSERKKAEKTLRVGKVDPAKLQRYFEAHPVPRPIANDRFTKSNPPTDKKGVIR